MENLTFKDLGLSDSILQALKNKGFEEPTPIQAKVIPALLQGNGDILGQAQTGTGKTAAFGIPLLEKITDRADHVQALILAPTRELAVQVAEEINSLKGDRQLSIAPIYGGQSLGEQLRRLRRGVDIVVGTPGRVMDHMERGSLDLSKTQWVILDEADEMLNMGFVEDVEKILTSVNTDRRMMLFSATMPERIIQIAKRFMGQYELISVKSDGLTKNLTDQIYIELEERDKFEALCRIIDVEEDFYGVVFCRTKLQVDDVHYKLQDRGYDADALHGDVSQTQRELILKKFKTKKVNVMVATDVAARGIDVSDLTHVINYSLPQDPEAYVHRIGRTGRAGKQGTAVTFITRDEYRKLTFIQRVSKSEIRREKVPAVQEIIALKKNRILSQIDATIESAGAQAFIPLAEEFLNERNPVDVLAALLKQEYGQELDLESYAPIRDLDQKTRREFPERPRHFSEDTLDHGKTRLFVGLGRGEGMSPRKLVDLIKVKTGIQDRFINDVSVFDDFCFLTVSFKDAEHILAAFGGRMKDNKPLISRAEGHPLASLERKRPSYDRKPGGYERKSGESGGAPWQNRGTSSSGSGSYGKKPSFDKYSKKPGKPPYSKDR